MTRSRFWTLPLEDLAPAEWEALCDGCGRCCLLKLEDEETGELAYTTVHCRLYDPDTCRCGNYARRRRLVPGCVVLTPENIAENAPWMPSTCAYRLRHEGAPLPEWHPLLSGDPASPVAAGIAADGVNPPGALTPEWEVDEEDLEDYALEGTL